MLTEYYLVFKHTKSTGSIKFNDKVNTILSNTIDCIIYDAEYFDEELNKIINVVVKRSNKVKKEKEFYEYIKPHANIITYYGWFIHDGVYCIVLEKGDYDMFEYLRKNIDDNTHKINLHKMFKYISEAMNGIQYLYNKSIIYSDIKIENILIVNDVAKICDIDDTSFTPVYVSPEYILTRSHNIESLTWACAILTYIVCTGTLPYTTDHNNISVIKRKIELGVRPNMARFDKENKYDCLKATIYDIFTSPYQFRPLFKVLYDDLKSASISF